MGVFAPPLLTLAAVIGQLQYQLLPEVLPLKTMTQEEEEQREEPSNVPVYHEPSDQ